MKSWLTAFRKYTGGKDGKPVKPVVYKFSPDLPQHILEQDIKIAIDHNASGISVTNTTTDQGIRQRLRHDRYQEEMGGISGSPLREKALSISNAVFEYTGGTLPIKRAGGIKTAGDVWNALTYGGASVVDVYTAFVRRSSSTPNFAHYILFDLAKAMLAEDMQSMEDFKMLRGQKVAFPLI